MCTAATYSNGGFYFGRNLDYEFSYGESVTVTPREFVFDLRHLPKQSAHFAFIGMAHVHDGYPLYYDAMNEKGLCVAGLNFVGNARYFPAREGKVNVAQFELIPWLMSSFESVSQVRAAAEQLNITDEPFCDGLPTAQLHWLIADKDDCVVLESTYDGVHIYDNPAGVLTNNPPFPVQMSQLNNYMALSPRSPLNSFAPDIPLTQLSRGMGAIGLPGDLSSQSRFVRAAFVRSNSRSEREESKNVTQFFHILTSVEQQRGCCEVAPDKYEITIYSSCCSADSGCYYYTTYDRRSITAVSLKRADLDSDRLTSYPLRSGEIIGFEN